MRTELQIISEWIEPGKRILDLGCGDGTLLAHLWKHRKVTGFGLEINDSNIVSCIEKDVTVIQADLDAGLGELFSNDSFDYVVMTQTLQAVHHPASLLDDMLRVGKQGIVTFPNLGYWKNRLQIALRGRMPVTRSLPEQWYDTPNIHLCTLKDFEALCKLKNIHILERAAVDHRHRSRLGSRLLPNALSEIAIYRFTRTKP